MPDKKGNICNLSLMDYLSGGNHELFHSNILVYIGKNFPDVFLNLLNLGNDIPEELKNYSPQNLRREYLSFDISITDGKGNFLLVVENKMKSIPMENQLNQYKEKAENNNNKSYKREIKNSGANTNLETSSDYVIPRFVLLTLVVPESVPKSWKVIDYEQLKDNLKNILSKKDSSEIEREMSLPELNLSRVAENESNYLIPLLQDYVEYIKKLHENISPKTIKEKVENGTFKLVRYNDDENKKNKWLHLFKRKLAFERMKIMMREKLKEKLGEKNLKYISFSAGVTRATPFMSIEVWFDENNEIKEYNPKEKGENDTVFWIQIYGHEIQKGFSIPLEKSKEDKKSKNKIKKSSSDSNNEEPETNKETGETAEKVKPQAVKRQEIIKRMWGECKKSYPHFRSIGEDVLNENFCKNCFIPLTTTNKKLRAYIYKDDIMLFVPSDISETTKIVDKINEVAEQVAQVIMKNLRSSKPESV